MGTNPPLQPPPEPNGIRIGDVGGSVNFSALGDIVGGDKITTITTTIQISVEAVTQRPLITASPYRGLDRFEDRDKDLFFGRDQLIKSLLAQLSASNVLLVLGASGSGKSSVVRAGLLPHLSQLIGARFRYFTFVPDVNPFESLRSALQGAGFSQAQTRELGDARPETPAKLVRALQREGDQWLVFVDQFEEIFTVGDETLRASFIAALVQIAQDPNSSTKLVLAMRADFLDRFSPFPQFAKIIEKNIDFVADMHADELRQAIEQPAARHGVVFEQGLVEEIIKDVQGQAGSLPLLQYTLDLLWQEEAREDGLADRHLNTKAYHELGGVRGALQKRADEIYDAFAEGIDGKTASPKQEIVRQIFLRLVDLAGEGSNDAAWRPVRRRASIAMFATGQEQEILQALINQKLLVSNREGDDATVEVAHEALFTSWGRLKNWIDAGKQVIFAKNRLADDARRWQRRRQDAESGADEELLSGSRLAQAIDMRGRGDFLTVVGGLGDLETQFLDASVTLRDRRAQEEQARQQRELEAAQRLAAVQKIAAGRLRKGLVVAVALALLAIAGGLLALLQSRTATTQKGIANAEASHSEYLNAFSLVDDGDADLALRSLANSLDRDSSNPAVATRLLNLLGQRRWPHLVAKTERSPLGIRSLDVNANASRIIVATQSAQDVGMEMEMEDQTISLRDAETLGARGEVKLGCFAISDIKTKGDRVLATGIRADMAVLLNAQDGGEIKKWTNKQGEDARYNCAFSDDGKWALVAFITESNGGGTLEIVSSVDGKPHPALPSVPFGKALETMAMTDTEIRFLHSDGSVTIQSLQGAKVAGRRTFPLLKEVGHPQFAGESVITLAGEGLEFWPLSQSGKNETDKSQKIPSRALTLYNWHAAYGFGNVNFAFRGAGVVTVVAHDSYRPYNQTRSCAAELHTDADTTPFLVSEWESTDAPVCLLAPSIAVARDTKAFVIPFHGGYFSGPIRHESQITAICEVREGSLATSAADGVVKLWKFIPPAFSSSTPTASTLKKEGTNEQLRWRSLADDVEIWDGDPKDGLVEKFKQPPGKKVPVRMPRESLEISSVELAPDGERGIFSAHGEGEAGGATSGAWIFSAKDGTLLSDSVAQCAWAGFSSDGKKVLTIKDGRVTIWNLRLDEKGSIKFEGSGRVLPQGRMETAALAENGGPLATRSKDGEVIVWDANGKPLHWLNRNRLWDLALPSERQDLIPLPCKPALSADGRRLATPYEQSFVIWDVESGKPLSDPIFCSGEIQSLAFPERASSKLKVTLHNGSEFWWDYAGLDNPLAKADVTILRDLAVAVAEDKWVTEAPKLAASNKAASPALAKLLEHFASQARALSENAPKPASAPSASK
jgi:WD40 repeat protein/energy-coupling factor transporter ATP-binding protein EcfA2